MNIILILDNGFTHQMAIAGPHGNYLGVIASYFLYASCDEASRVISVLSEYSSKILIFKDTNEFIPCSCCGEKLRKFKQVKIIQNYVVEEDGKQT